MSQDAAPRALRECDECHVVDDLGHHQVVHSDHYGFYMLSRHFACCARTGCPDGSCHEILGRTP